MSASRLASVLPASRCFQKRGCLSRSNRPGPANRARHHGSRSPRGPQAPRKARPTRPLSCRRRSRQNPGHCARRYRRPVACRCRDRPREPKRPARAARTKPAFIHLVGAWERVFEACPVVARARTNEADTGADGPAVEAGSPAASITVRTAQTAWTTFLGRSLDKPFPLHFKLPGGRNRQPCSEPAGLSIRKTPTPNTHFEAEGRINRSRPGRGGPRIRCLLRKRRRPRANRIR